MSAAHRRHPRHATGQRAIRSRPVAVCDVWDGNATLGRRPDGTASGRGLFPSARRCGLNVDDRVHVNKDYRRILELREVDAVCIATPDHWHAKMCIDAAAAGKHIYCEKPMTKTIYEAHAVVDAVRRNNVVMTVGVQWMADPSLRRANDMIKRGDIGHVAQAQTSYYRNSRSRPMALLSAHAGHEPDHHRLGHVPRPSLLGGRGRAARHATGRSTGPTSRNGAATGISAAACSPTCSSTASLA